MSATRDVIQFAKKNGGAFTTREAIALGLPKSTLNRRVSDGIFVRIGRGHFTLPGASTRPDVLLHAAGRHLGAVVSHESAALIHGLTPIQAKKPTVTVPYRGTHSFPGVTVHQSTDLLPEHTTTIGQLKVTTVARTLLDLAKVLSKKRLERVLDHALASRKVDLDELVTLYLALTRQGKRGMKWMGELLADRAGDDLAYSESELETMLFQLIVDSGLPPPRKQFRAPWLKPIRGRVDMAYPDQKIVIEGDGRRWHALFDAFGTDRRRDNAAQLSGWIVLRFTWEMIVKEPESVIADVRRALAIR
ncbi:MAG: type IV toxin-antitoxin system AbiEi family antitoxin domain-containing protein [Actinomycetota bacterium]|nr:type IV toxin-antitoxin system AbiEi family antitoxin domain-containing protein [Actinomycetota bacterium]